MKVLAIMGSPRRRGNGYHVVKRVEARMAELGDVDVAYLFLREVHLEMCRGCMVCYREGETGCPLDDDLLDVVAKMQDADGLVIISPTYVANVSGLMKNYIDRLSTFCHRPIFYKKFALLITNTAAVGAWQAMMSLTTVAESWSLNVVGRVMVKTPEPPNEQGLVDVSDRDLGKLDRGAAKLYRALAAGELPRPSTFQMAIYRYRQRVFEEEYDTTAYEHRFWKEQGWLAPDRYHFQEIEVGPVQAWMARSLSRLLERVM
jgi:multimeric flavodoxin WrbA